MSVLRDTTVGFGFTVTLTGHAKHDKDFWQDPSGEADTLLRQKMDDEFRDNLLIVHGIDAWSGAGADDRKFAVLLKGKRGKGKNQKSLLGGYESSGFVNIKADLAQPTQADQLILDEVLGILEKAYGRKIKKISKFDDYGWHVVGSVS